MLGLYVHIPFCSAICNYCNFNRGLFDADLKARYVDALVAEIARGPASPSRRRRPTRSSSAAARRRCSSPTKSRASSARAATRSTSPPTREVTLEANPETVDRGAARGVSRRRRQPPQLRRPVVPRRRAAAAVAAALAPIARAARVARGARRRLRQRQPRPDDVAARAARRRLAANRSTRAIALGARPPVAVLLEVYPNAPLKDEMARARLVAGARRRRGGDVSRRRWSGSKPPGYAQYEISNVARPGRRSRHNLKYWTDGEWLGFGCGAHSTRDGVRWKNVSATEDYVDADRPRRADGGRRRAAVADERLGDALFTGLRLSTASIWMTMTDRYGVDVWRRFGAELRAVSWTPACLRARWAAACG